MNFASLLIIVGAIAMFDKIILTFKDGDKVPGFTDRHVIY